MKLLSKIISAIVFGVVFAPTISIAQSQDAPISTCLAIAQNISPMMPRVQFASATASPLAIKNEVTITFSGHSTYRIESPQGVIAATDFGGFFGSQPTLPRIVTMNQAHSTHYTTNPDPAIEHVLPGWGTGSAQPADHDVVVDDMYVRNVTTDIRSFADGMIADANSIFIFEVAGLCIGHLGHLHHPLTDAHFAEIGRLDIVMVPVDGGLTLSHERMADITTRLRSSIVLPMHLRGNRIDTFINRMGADWAVDFLKGDTITVDVRSLPKQPTILVPASLASRG